MPSDVGLLAEEAGNGVAEESAALETSEDRLSCPVADCGESGRGTPVECEPESRACGARCALGDAKGVVLVMGGVFESPALFPWALCRCGCWRFVGAADREEVACSTARPAAWSGRCCVGAHWRARPSSSATGGPFNLRRRLDRRHKSCIH